MWNTGINHGSESGLQWDNGQNMNKDYRLVTDIISIPIWVFVP